MSSAPTSSPASIQIQWKLPSTCSLKAHDHDGSLLPLIYYTDYARGRLGQYDPTKRQITEWPSPGGSGSRPYGIAITPDGAVWYSESGLNPNTIVQFDPRTESFASWPIPSGGGVVRNMVSTPTGDLYIACSGVNKVGIVKVER